MLPVQRLRGKCGSYGPPFAHSNNSCSLLYMHCDSRCHRH